MTLLMRRLCCAGLTVAVLMVAGVSLATTTRSFRQTTVKDFEEGEATSSMVAPPGEVLPGMKTARVAIDAAFAWCAALSPDNRTAYFGTGNRGRIFALPTTGNDPAKKLADIEAPWVTALAVRPNGDLLAGSTPGGRVFSINAKTGASSVLTKLPVEHVWALVDDATHGKTYAATGDSGKIFAIDAKGGARLLWDADDKHVMSLAVDGATLLAGTADKAILYRIHGDGHAEALHDFDADEVRAIVRGKAVTYVAVNDFDKPADTTSQTTSPGVQPAKGTHITAAAPASGTIARTDQVKSRAAIYRLDDDGRIEQLFALADGYFTSLVLDRQGNLFAATGNQGKLYRIAPDRTVALAADMPERQALSLLAAGEGFLVGTGDVGAIYRVRPAVASEASYLSKIFDAEVQALWGQVAWLGSPDLVMETRSGNTGKPDASWSGFHRILRTPDGDHSGRVQSPASRYLQYRVILPGRASVLKDISLYYLPQNQRARITEVSLGDSAPSTASATGGTTGSSSATSARVHVSTLKLRWKVENPDNDELIYKLSFRQEGESLWRPLGGPDPLGKPEYDWNTDSVPDGRYVIRVWASDEKVTPAGQALDNLFESPPFLVDNTKPEIVGLTAHPTSVTGRARDAASVISAIEYSIDGGEWWPAQPDDQLLDQREEAFTVGLPKGMAGGPHIINVRAWDSADNLGAARIEIRAGK